MTEELSRFDDIAIGVSDADYEAPSDFSRPPDAGTYTLIRVVEDEAKDWMHGRFVTRDDQAAAWFNFKAEIQGGPFAGRRVSGGMNTLTSSFRKASTVDDFLRSAKSSARPRTIKEAEEQLPKVFGPFTARVDWEWTCMDCKDDRDKPITFLRGQRNPRKPKRYDGPALKVEKDAKGETPHVVKCPECGRETGARAVIQQFVVKTGATTTATVKTSASSVTLPPSAG